MTESHPGIFFLEKQLLINFDDYCRSPLELDDPLIRRMYFKHYGNVVYIRQPQDPDLSAEAREVAALLELDLRILDADYTELHDYLKHIIPLE